MISTIIYVTGLMLIFFILLLGQQLLFYRSGLFFLGGAAMFACGAYLTALFSMKLGLNPLLSVLISAILTGLISFLIGYPLLKLLRQDYFALATLALAQASFVLLRSFAPGGNAGISGIPSLNTHLYSLSAPSIDVLIILLCITAFCLLVIFRISRTRFGRLVDASRIDENMTSILGFSPLKIRSQVFLLAGIFAGGAGALQAHYIGAVDPTLSSIQMTILILCGTILSGNKSFWGCSVGTVFIILLPEVLQRLLTFLFGSNWIIFQWVQVLYGLIIVILVFTVFPVKKSFLKSDVGG